MGRSIAGLTPRLDFALIGHPENWRAAADVFSALRGAPLPDDEVKDILPWIPPRAICHVEVQSIRSAKASGVYVDSFISPDRLDSTFVRENLTRVREAAAYAIHAGARLVSLGGFSSILIEGNFDQLPSGHETVFTTGNTLTVAFIVQGIERMCASQGRTLESSTLLVIGATGDVGSGCVRCLAPKVKRLLLYARNAERLRRLKEEMEGLDVEIATDFADFSHEADLVICAASLPSPTPLSGPIATDALICDAGYPKNVVPDGHTTFFGGLGQITGGMRFEPDLRGILNRHPFPNVAHGCLLEGIALALEGRFEPFSRGRGGITPNHVEEIASIAARHGIVLAPFYNGAGPLQSIG